MPKLFNFSSCGFTVINKSILLSISGTYNKRNGETIQASGGWINIKVPSYQYRDCHFGDKTILWSSYLHNGIPYPSEMKILFWIGAQLYLAKDVGVNNCSDHINIDCHLGHYYLIEFHQHTQQATRLYSHDVHLARKLVINWIPKVLHGQVTLGNVSHTFTRCMWHYHTEMYDT